MIIITREKLEKYLDVESMIEATREAFRAYSWGLVTVASPLFLSLPDGRGEICVKTAISGDLPTYTIKQVSVMAGNATRGIPSLQATMNVYQSDTGELLAVIEEQGYLTGMRTACAAALAERMFRPQNPKILGVVGAGAQAEHQANVLFSTGAPYREVLIWNRTYERAEKLCRVLTQKFQDVNFTATKNISDVMSRADTIITSTSSTGPLIDAGMMRQGTTLIGVGADMPEKCEIAPSAYQKADKVFVDGIASNRMLGDLSRAFKDGALSESDITGELGDVIRGKVPGRTGENESIIVKLVGLGAQDTYIGDLAYRIFKDL